MSTFYIQELKGTIWITLCDVKDFRFAKRSLFKYVKNDNWQYDKYRIFTEDGNIIQLTLDEVSEVLNES